MLCIASRDGCREIVESMIRQYSISVSDYNGVLCTACSGGHIEIVQIFLDLLTSLQGLNRSECNLALKFARLYGHTECAVLLRKVWRSIFQRVAILNFKKMIANRSISD